MSVCNYNPLRVDKDARNIIGRKEHLQQMLLKRMDSHISNKEIRLVSVVLHEISQWIKAPNKKHLNCQKKKKQPIGSTLHGIGVGRDFAHELRSTTDM